MKVDVRTWRVSKEPNLVWKWTLYKKYSTTAEWKWQRISVFLPSLTEEWSSLWFAEKRIRGAWQKSVKKKKESVYVAAKVQMSQLSITLQLWSVALTSNDRHNCNTKTWAIKCNINEFVLAGNHFYTALSRSNNYMKRENSCISHLPTTNACFFKVYTVGNEELSDVCQRQNKFLSLTQVKMNCLSIWFLD